MSRFILRRLAVASLLLWSFGALAEHYTVPLLVSAGTSSEPQGVVRILNAADESGTVEIYAIDDAGTRSGPATFTLNASAAVQFTATDLASGNATLGLTGGIGTNVGDARLQIETDLSIVPLAFVRAADGTLSAMHDTVRGASATDGSDGYTYEVPIFNPASDVTQVSRLRLINPGDAAAAVMIGGRDDSGAPATGGDVTLMLAAGGAQTLSAQQLEAGDTAITGRLGAGTGKWRLTVSSDRPLQVVNIVAASTGYWNNLSTTAVPGAASVDLDAFNERFVGNAVVYVTGSSRVTLNAQTGERFTETEEIDGVSTTYMGSYGYSAISPDAGRLTLTYNDGDVCAANLYFATRTAGWFASRCTGSDYPADGTWLGGSWSIADGEDTLPVLGSPPGNRTYTVGTAIDALTLPAASGGNGTLAYSLSPDVPGLSFNATARQLTGTPSTAGTYTITYTVMDEDGDTDTLGFTITVSAGTTQTGSLRECYVSLMVGIGQRCTYPGTTDAFSVNVRGRGRFLTFLAGIRIRIDNQTINGQVYDFEASHQGDGVWRIDRIAGSTEAPETPPMTGGGGMESEDTSPSFAADVGPGNRTYTVGTAIGTLTLPEASGGDGTLGYSLSPDVPGLSFNATARQLSGTPSTAGTYAMTYTVTDDDGDADTLDFAITVEESDDDGDSVAGAMPIPDANLRAAIMAALERTGNAPITDADMESLTSLSASRAGISDLTGLDSAINLTRLNLFGNRIEDISALSSLTNLTWLELGDNNITDISALSGLTGLSLLLLAYNSIADFSHLQGLTNLANLDLSRTGISHVSTLSGLTNLRSLSLSDNPISTLSPLAGMTNLTRLALGNTGISDVSALAGLTNLTRLNLSRNDISELSPLSSLTNLTWLNLSVNNITDVSALSSLTSLQTLDLRGNFLSDSSITEHIPVLESDGVEVFFHALPKGDFEIELIFLADFTESQKRELQYGARRWMSVIVDDLRDHELAEGRSGTCGDQSFEIPSGERIDDLRIYVGTFEHPIHSGYGGPTLLREESLLPAVGCLAVNLSLAYLYITGLHEIGHVLGFGSLWYRFGFLQDLDGDLHFNGPLAIAAFDEAGGSDYTGAKVPVEPGGHWRRSVFPDELMRGGGGPALSAITVQSLADLGYGVDVTQADPYNLPDAAAAPVSGNITALIPEDDPLMGGPGEAEPVAARGFILEGSSLPGRLALASQAPSPLSCGIDLWTEPLQVVDPQGRVTRILGN